MTAPTPNPVTKVVVDAVEQVVQNGMTVWRIRCTRTHEDGTELPTMHVLPVDALEWRAAEYGIDPTDLDTLVDIVLAEPFLNQRDFPSGEALWDAPTVEDAKTAHVARCARAKLAVRMSTRGKGHPLNEIKKRPNIDPVRMAVKTIDVAVSRHHEGVEILPVHLARALTALTQSARQQPES